MKTQVFDHFRSGLLLLAMFTVAVVAGQVQPNAEDALPTDNSFELDADFRIAIDHERLEKLELLLSAIEPVLELPIKVKISTDEFVAPDIADTDSAPVQ